MQDTKIKLTGVKVIFYSPTDEGFGCSITIDCTPPEVEKQIVDWVKRNNIGKQNPGVANVKEYTPEGGETTRQFQFKLNDKTQYAGVNGLTKDDIGYGAVVDLIANSYIYNNKFSGGKDMVAQSVSAIVVRSAGGSSNAADLADLLGDATDAASSEEINVSEVPF